MARPYLARYSKPGIFDQMPQVTTDKLFTTYAIVASQRRLQIPSQNSSEKLPILTPQGLFLRFQGFANPPFLFLLRPT